jgi:hypothetical protein
MADTLDFPFDDCVEGATAQVRKGHTVFQKFTCRSCGARQTIDDPNQFYTHGKCEECGETTDIRVSGCNYLLIASGDGVADALVDLIMRKTR